jgi:8-oxo-dGTP diphosphatase
MLEVSAGVIVSGTKVLVFQRGESRYPYISGKYEFPGGKIEKGENPLQALERELHEELDLDIAGARTEFLCDTSHGYPDFAVRLYTYLIFMDDVPFTLSEHQMAVWSEIRDLPKFDWAEADRDIVSSLMSRMEQ